MQSKPIRRPRSWRSPCRSSSCCLRRPTCAAAPRWTLLQRLRLRETTTAGRWLGLGGAGGGSGSGSSERSRTFSAREGFVYTATDAFSIERCNAMANWLFGHGLAKATSLAIASLVNLDEQRCPPKPGLTACLHPPPRRGFDCQRARSRDSRLPAVASSFDRPHARSSHPLIQIQSV